MRSTSRVQIDLSAISHNVRVLRRIIGSSSALCPIVKADAYGLGAARIAKHLAFEGAEMLAVYTPQQAADLSRSAIDVPILVLMPVREITRVDDLYRAMISGRLHLTVHDIDHLGDLRQLADRFGAILPLHLEVDTGMSRGGCDPLDATEIMEEIAQSQRLRLAGLFTHFAHAEADSAFTDQQLKRFDRVMEHNKELIPSDCVIHAANSFATLRHRRYHKSMVRVGLAWAGYGLDSLADGEVIVEGEDLQPILTWTSQIVQVKGVRAGTVVGYGCQWTAKRDSWIGLVPVGYGDGYPIGLGATNDKPNAASVSVVLDTPDGPGHGYVPVVGAVNMDQITIDLTDLLSLPGSPGARVGVGTEVELITPHPAAPNHLSRLAEMAGTIPHEMICRLNPQIPRVYRHEHLSADLVMPVPAAAG